jgi:uncharacterized protein YndB with AHSA1/START domain
VITVEETVEIGRPAEEVFAYVSDQTNAPRWQRGLVEVRRTTEGPIGVGSRHTFVRTLAGRTTRGTNEYTRYEPDRLVAFDATSGGWPVHASYEVEPTDAASARLIARIEMRPTGVFRVAEPLIGWSLRRDARANLRTLKRSLEAG